MATNRPQHTDGTGGLAVAHHPEPDTPTIGGRPVPSGVPYHRVLAGERRRVGRGILVLALLLVGWAVVSLALIRLSYVLDLTLFGRTNAVVTGGDYTPLYHAGTMAGIAVLIPWSMLLQRWFYRAPAASLHSVRSRFRFDLFGRSLVTLGVFWVTISILFSSLQAAPEPIDWQLGDLYGVLLVSLLLTPLQCAGEEYGLRGLAMRVAGSWARGPRVALFLAVTVSALLFALIHLSTDPFLNAYYLGFAVSTALITWRTGGLEVAIVLHAVNNTVGFIVMVLVRDNPLGALTDRGAGAGGPETLLPVLCMVPVVAVVFWLTRRRGPVTT